MKISKLLSALVVPALAAACSFPGTTFELDELREATPSGPPFTQALTHEYTAFAEAQRLEADWLNSQHFAEKGLLTAHGTAVGPEEPAKWDIASARALQDLTAARARLVAILGTNAPTRAPALTATAQVKFDCWVEEQSEGWNEDDIAACRKDFMAAADALEGQKIAAPPPPPPPPALKAAKTDRYLVFFDFNQSVLNKDAAVTVDQVAKAAKAAGYPRLSIIGYTDLSGSRDYDLKLSLRRAETVRKALMAAGVPADRLGTEGRGKNDPLVPTADGVREPQNRRAVVEFPN